MIIEEVRSRDGLDLILTADQCSAFREHIGSLETAALESVLRDLELLCKRSTPPWEQFEWKRNACLEELRRRSAGDGGRSIR